MPQDYCENTCECVHYNMQMLWLVRWVFKLIGRTVGGAERMCKNT